MVHLNEKPVVGILMLDTQFYRPVGDIGNPRSFSFPVIYHIVKQATVERVVKQGDPSLIQPFIKAGKELEAKGVRVITTSCGFLALFQKDIQKHLSVPFISSSLLQIPLVHHMSGGVVGVLTAKKSSLTKRHFEGVGADHVPLVTYGMDDKPAFTNAIIEETEALQMDLVEQEMKEAVREMLDAYPNIRSIVLECTNMPPYREALKEVTNLPIFDILTLVNYVYDSFK